jgi:hypothetical protein
MHEPNPYTDPTFLYDADPDPDPISSYTQAGKSGILFTFFQAMPILLSFSSV